MPFLQSFRKPSNSNIAVKDGIVSEIFHLQHKDRYRKFCNLMLEHKMYAPLGQFKHLWKHSDYLDTVYAAYLMKAGKPLGVAFIERGYDFGFPMPSSAEGFISCFVKQEYRGSGIAASLCKTVLEEGAFREVAGQIQLRPAVMKAGNYKFHVTI